MTARGRTGRDTTLRDGVKYARGGVSPWLLGVLMVLPACQPPRSQAPVELDAPKQSTALGPGDIFLVEVVGEQDLPQEYQVASDGTVALPYIASLAVAGLEPQEVAQRIREELISREILTAPSVIVRVKEYRSQRVTVLGQVQSPGSFQYSRGLTLVEAISQAGGLNAIAQGTRVRLTRALDGGRSKTVIIDLDSINAGVSEDIPLQAGDRIYVAERVF